MKDHVLKMKFATGQLILGSWITIGNENVAEIMSRMAFDLLTIDMEHSRQ